MRLKSRFVVAVTMCMSVTGFNTDSVSAKGKCSQYSGRNYIVCKESGPQHMPEGLPEGYPHPGPSSAAGPCGMLKATRMKFGGSGLVHCGRYMRSRYGSWDRAEAFHRANNWW
jgi:hypothetical protein